MRVFQDANGNGLYDAGESVLADYAYDAFGRRVEFANVGAGTTTRYYHDGVRVIQERDAADNLVRSHVHGAQYLDEHVSTFESSGGRTGRSSYYLLGANFSVVGVGDADGGEVRRLEYTPAGDRVGPGGGLFFDADDDGDLDLADWVSLAGCLTGPTTATGPGCVVHDFTRDGAVDLADAAEFQRHFSGDGNPASPACRRAGSYAHDADGDGDVDIDDYLSYELCLTAPPDEPPDAVCLAFHDFDVAGESDGRVDLDDFGGLANCFRGSGQTPPPECFRPAPAGEVPGSGSFALHGSMVDVLSGGRGPGDELALQYSRARYFDLKHGRFLQRDPKGYIDGANLYEAFASNPARFTDPMGFWTEEGVIDAFISAYGDDDATLFAALEILSRYSLEQGTSLWFNDYWVDHKARKIFIADDNCWFERSNENAAYQLYRVIAEEFYGITNLPETWEGWAVRNLSATGKTVGGGLSVVGGGLLLAVPEPTLATKVGGGGAIVFGANTVFEGVTQFKRRPGGGGINPLGELADLYQETVQGEVPEEWYLRARTYVLLSGTAFELAAGGGFSKFMRTTPIRQLPSATKDAITRGYQKLAARTGAYVDDAAAAATHAGRPAIHSSLGKRVTEALPEGQVRTPAEVRQARNFYKKHADEAKDWWSRRTGEPWPEGATHAEHPRAIADGGDPLFVEPGFSGPTSPHMVPGPDGLTDFQRWGSRGARLRRNP